MGASDEPCKRSFPGMKVVDYRRQMVEPDIAPATDEERDWAAELMARSEPWLRLRVTPEQSHFACRDPGYRLFVAHVDGVPCGAIVLQQRGVAGSPYVKSVVVDGEHRGHGIGTALMEFAENLFRSEARHIFLCVSSFNTRARAFYERRGYRAVGEFEDYVIDGAEEVLMHKRLR